MILVRGKVESVFRDMAFLRDVILLYSKRPGEEEKDKEYR